MGANHREEGLVRLLEPFVGNQQQQVPTPDIEHAMEDTSSMRAPDGDAHLLPKAPVALIQGWDLRDDGLIEHQDDRALPYGQAAFEPPFACRHVVGRRARSCRGRFHRRPRREMARLTLVRDTPIWCCFSR